MQEVVTTSARPGRDRPSRAQIEPAALALLSRHSAGLLATARRYSVTPEDAEDAYQRGVEILLTKAPTTSEAELLPWLRTVVKHEAYAVRRAAGRAEPTEDAGASEPDEIAWTDERAERYERLRVGAEAMSRLKPQEIRCLLLKAEGLSYNEICEATGWTYTKVNRCITEGRRSFLAGVASIESGAECRRLAPLISKAADGEATAAEMRAVRPHLKGCLACKATLREYRAAPARVAGLVPPVAVIAGGGGHGPLARVLHALHDRLAGLAEIVSAPKAAALAASAAVIAGGGAAGVEALHHDPPVVERAAFESPVARMAPQPEPRRALPLPAAPRARGNGASARSGASETTGSASGASTTGGSATDSTTDAAGADSGAPEFDPGISTGASATRAEGAASTGSASPSTGSASPSSGSTSPPAGSTSQPAEFGP